MLYEMKSKYSVTETCKRIEETSSRNKFGILATHDLRAKMNDKGVEFTSECRVIEICNPFQAKKVLDANISLSTLLPCRISVYQNEGQTIVSTLKPTSLVSGFPGKGLKEVAIEVETTIVKIINDACR